MRITECARERGWNRPDQQFGNGLRHADSVIVPELGDRQISSVHEEQGVPVQKGILRVPG